MRKIRNPQATWNTNLYRGVANKQYNNQALFIHIPKTAGRYLRRCLKEAAKQGGRRVIDFVHCPVKFVKVYMERRKRENLFSFALVRNPYSRFYSACKFAGYKDPQDIENISERLLTSGSIDWLSDYSLFHMEHFFTQKHFVTDFDGEVIVSLIGKYEFLDEFIVNLQENNIDITNIFKVKYDEDEQNWENILTTKTKRNIEIIYSDDFELFKYELCKT